MRWVCWDLKFQQSARTLMMFVTKLCLTLCNPMNCSLPGSSIYGIFPVKNTLVCYHFLLQGIIPTQGSNTQFLHCRWFLYHWATREALRYNSVQFSHSVMSDSLGTHGLQHSRPPCPSPTPRVYSSSFPLSRWCHPTISSSVNHFFLCCPLLLLLSMFPSISVFSSESALHIRWPKYCSFSFSIGPSNKYLGLISFRIDWFDLLAVQGTLKSILQHWKLKASVLWHSAFLMVQLSHPYMTADYMITWLLDMVFMYFEPFI